MHTVLRPLAFLLVLMVSAPCSAQDDEAIDPGVRAEGRRIFAEADAHVAAERWAMAADAYQRLYDFMSQHRLPRAPVAHWNRGLALMRIAGREREARDSFQRFLNDSNQLTDDADVRDWRSAAIGHVAELDARLGGAAPSAPTPSGGGGGISPVGPVLLGVGGAAAIAGAILGGVVLAQDGELTAMCPDGRCPSSAQAFADEVASLALAADILLIGGAVIAATGLVLTFVLTESSATVNAGCGPSGCGAQLRGTF